MLRMQTINEFLKVLASDAPTPGGGSVAALNGALGCALLEMVCDLTLSKKKYEEVWQDLEPIKTELENLREELTDSIDRDAMAYETVTAAFKLPKTNDEEKKARREAIQQAFKTAAETPKATARYIHQALKFSGEVAEKGNPNVLSDAGVGAACLLAGLQAALMNIAINIGGIKDESYVDQAKTEMDFLRNECEKLANATLVHAYKDIGL